VGVPHTSAAFSATLRVHLDNRPGAFARMAAAIGEAGGSLDAIDLVRLEHGKKVRDVTVLASDEAHIARITQAVSIREGIEVERVSDRTLLLHQGGKLEIASRVPLKTLDDLSMAYTPGVARACIAIADDPDSVWSLTTKQNSVAIVTDGTAVLGLGEIGPEAALPVMEGKAILFKEFGGVDAWPICLATTDADEIVQAVAAIAPGFGGINLEDIAAPRCFEIEARLRERLDIPVFHDDQHGTAIVVLAAVSNALRVVGKRLEDARIVVTGAGAAGSATVRMLAAAGAGDVVCCDIEGALCAGRDGLDPFRAALAELSNPRMLRGTADEALAGADLFVGLSAPGAVTVEGVRTMAHDAICSPWRTRHRRSLPRRSKISSPSWAPDVPTTRTRSTTCLRSPASFAARSMSVRRRSPRAWSSQPRVRWRTSSRSTISKPTTLCRACSIDGSRPRLQRPSPMPRPQTASRAGRR
jgi:malate dehydrogenase (oxaloacetate-decarboxylating)